jgi:hypothetical protein
MRVPPMARRLIIVVAGPGAPVAHHLSQANRRARRKIPPPTLRLPGPAAKSFRVLVHLRKPGWVTKNQDPIWDSTDRPSSNPRKSHDLPSDLPALRCRRQLGVEVGAPGLRAVERCHWTPQGRETEASLSPLRRFAGRFKASRSIRDEFPWRIRNWQTDPS